MDLRMGGVMLQRSGTGLNLEFSIETSENLSGWDVMETIHRSLEMGSDKTFLRVRAGVGGEYWQ